MSLRRVEPNHKPWTPHSYQAAGVQHLKNNASAALFFSPGMGKTSVVLRAVSDLMERGAASKTLIVAPKRVCELVWKQEARKWTDFRHLRFCQLAGMPLKKREDALRNTTHSDIWLINFENLPWLRNFYFGRQPPFDTVVLDELTKVKNPQSLRSKSLQHLAKACKRRWGLTGTPAPNGYMDLFGQMLALDGGLALGKYITQYRDTYFQTGHDGFSYFLRDGAAARIEARIAPYVLYADPKDYLELPEISDNVITVSLDKAARKVYDDMKRDAVAAINDGTITAANVVATYSKLKQIANGGVYSAAEAGWTEIHTHKLDALAELIEELNGAQLLVAYEFRHDLERLLRRWPDTPFLGGGVSAKDAKAAVDGWNAGKVRLLFAHPASAGHGLNMQESGCGNICWFSQTWDYELYEQFINRVRRQGSTAARVINHKIFVADTIDELVAKTLGSKATTQDALLAALKSELGFGEIEMTAPAFRKLGSPGVAAQTVHTPAPQPAAPPVGTFTPPPFAPQQRAAAPAPVAAPVTEPVAEPVDQPQITHFDAPAPAEPKKSPGRPKKTFGQDAVVQAVAELVSEKNVTQADAPTKERPFYASVQFDVAQTVKAVVDAGGQLDDALQLVSALLEELRK